MALNGNTRKFAFPLQDRKERLVAPVDILRAVLSRIRGPLGVLGHPWRSQQSVEIVFQLLQPVLTLADLVSDG
jgi:hypothetical protein